MVFLKFSTNILVYILHKVGKQPKVNPVFYSYVKALYSLYSLR